MVDSGVDVVEHWRHSCDYLFIFYFIGSDRVVQIALFGRLAAVLSGHFIFHLLCKIPHIITSCCLCACKQVPYMSLVMWQCAYTCICIQYVQECMNNYILRAFLNTHCMFTPLLPSSTPSLGEWSCGSSLCWSVSSSTPNTQKHDWVTCICMHKCIALCITWHRSTLVHFRHLYLICTKIRVKCIIIMLT